MSPPSDRSTKIVSRAPGFDARLRALPAAPGIYIMRNAENRIIYVGKAKSLKNRVRTYFGSLKDQTPKVWRLVAEIHDFEYVVTDSELEALILESQYIKKHKPHYNIRLKDDKSYPFIKVTVQEEWPRVVSTRKRIEDGSLYFGPYPGLDTINGTLEILDKLFPFRTCDKVIDGKDARPCVQYFIHRCLGPCASLADRVAYDRAIKSVILFLSGKEKSIVKQLEKEMNTASDGLQYERAAIFRDRLRTLQRAQEQQVVFRTSRQDQDVIAFAQDERQAVVEVFFVRSGKLLGHEHFMLEGAGESAPAEILESFIAQFYGDATYVPQQVFVQHQISDADIIQSWLRGKRGNKVSITVPRQGDHKQLIEMAAKNAAETLEQYRLRWLSDEQKSTAALTELQEALALPVWPRRIECYDVAHLQGTDTAGAMVVFEQGLPQKKEYRRFSIKASGNDDYASMREMLSRRFRQRAVQRSESERLSALTLARAQSETSQQQRGGFEAEANSNVERQEPVMGAAGRKGVASNWADVWAVIPDLVVIDGGKGQLNAAIAALREAGLNDLPVIALAKREEEVFTPWSAKPVVLNSRSEGLRLLQRIRDEAHRFSNNYNRKLGSKRGVRSKLDAVPKIGPKRKNALINQFGSVHAIADASVEQLIAVKGMDRAAALSLKEHLA